MFTLNPCTVLPVTPLSPLDTESSFLFQESLFHRIWQTTCRVFRAPYQWLTQSPPDPLLHKVDLPPPNQGFLEKATLFVKNNYGKMLVVGLSEIGRVYIYQHIFYAEPPIESPSYLSYEILTAGVLVAAMAGGGLYVSQKSVEAKKNEKDLLATQKITLEILTTLELKIKARADLIPSLSPLKNHFHNEGQDPWTLLYFEEGTLGLETQTTLANYFTETGELKSPIFSKAGEICQFSEKCRENQRAIQKKYDDLTSVLYKSINRQNLLTLKTEQIAEHCNFFIEATVYDINQMKDQFEKELGAFANIEGNILSQIGENRLLLDWGHLTPLTYNGILEHLLILKERWPMANKLIERLIELKVNFTFLDTLLTRKFTRFYIDDQSVGLSISLAGVYVEMIAIVKGLEATLKDKKSST